MWKGKTQKELISFPLYHSWVGEVTEFHIGVKHGPFFFFFNYFIYLFIIALSPNWQAQFCG